jgi:hypothetical protein
VGVTWYRRGYEAKCSPALALALGAWFGAYCGPNILHYSDGHLWFIDGGLPL